MSAPRDDVGELDRLARVQLSCTIEPADLPRRDTQPRHHRWRYKRL